MSYARSGGPWQRGTVADHGSVQCTFPLHPRSVRLARHVAKNMCRLWRAAGATDHAELAVSELFGNAVRAATGEEATLRMSWSPRRLRVEVRDADPRPPVVREALPTDQSGRGLCIVAATAVRWGSDRLPNGKCVWAEFALPA